MNRDEQILQLLQQQPVIRPKDIETLGIPRVYLYRLYERGLVTRLERGLYALPETETSAYSTLIEVSKRVPKGVICLISALYYYNITTQLPFEVWIAIEGTSWKPQIDYPPLHVMRFTGEAFTYGVETHIINNAPIRIYSIAKTVADCFKFRNKIGLDVALEALRETLQHKHSTVDAIWKAAKICRVANIMKPYLEAII